MGNYSGKRAWIKVQLNASAEAHEAAAQVVEWKRQRVGSLNLVKAVRLYAALCRADLSLLEADFPGLILAMTGRFDIRPHPAVPAPLKVTYKPRSEAEELDDALSGIGLDDLDFGN